MSEPAAELGANGLPLWNGYACPRDRDLRAAYGITLDDWQAIFDLQHGACGICGKPFTDKRRAVVDHQHEPPHLFRGLLCDGCNRKLSEALLAYLANPPAAKVASGPLYVPEERERARVAKLTARKEKAEGKAREQTHGADRRQAKRTPPSSAGQVGQAIDKLEDDLIASALAELSSNGYAEQIQQATEPSDYQAKVNRALAETKIREDHARRNGESQSDIKVDNALVDQRIISAGNALVDPAGPPPRRRRWRWW
jgi:hypothetical protein